MLLIKFLLKTIQNAGLFFFRIQKEFIYYIYFWTYTTQMFESPRII